MRYLVAFSLVVCILSNRSYADLVITEVMSSSQNVNNGDWWELTNTGNSGVDLTGYYWDDNGPMGNDGSLFGSYTILAGESIIIAEDSVAEFQVVWGAGPTVLDQSFMSGPDTFSGLSSNGDQIQLWDADPNAGPANLVAEVMFGASDGTGRSFEWDTNRNFLGFSNVGVHGAYQSLDDGAGRRRHRRRITRLCCAGTDWVGHSTDGWDGARGTPPK